MARQRPRKPDTTPSVVLGRVLDAAYDRQSDRDVARTLADLLGSGPAAVVSDASHALAAWTPAQRAELLADLRRFFDGLAALAASGTGGLVTELRIVGPVDYGAAAAGDAVILTIDASADDTLRLQVLALVAACGATRIQRCPAHQAGRPDVPCGTVFLRTGKREYCSDTCQARANQASWRDGQRRKSRRTKGR